MAVDPKAGISLIRDPLHNYIPFTLGRGDSEAGENDLLNSRWMQRLQRIYQLHAAWLVYPGATHTRYLHSLGTMHLAGEFASHLYSRFVDVHGAGAIPERNHVVEVLRLAGLLHDVGHSAFGHSFDQFYTHPKYGKTHEDIGRSIVTNELGEIIRRIKRSPEGPFDQTIEPAVVARFIKPDSENESASSFLPLWEQVFSKIITGLYSADTMDYLIRDAHFCGTKEYGIVDTERLILSSMVREEGLTLHASTVPALRSFLFSRLMMYQNVYYHKTVRAFDRAFCELLEKALPFFEIGDPAENLEKIYPIEDMTIHVTLSSWAESSDQEKKEIGEKWRCLLRRENRWKEAYRYEISYSNENPFFLRPASAEEMEKRLSAAIPKHIEFKVDMPCLDVRPQNPLAPSSLKKGVAIYDPFTDHVSRHNLPHFIKDLPMKFQVLRVFCPRENIAEVHRIARDVVESAENQLQESSF